MTRISWWRTSFGEEEVARIADSIAHEHVSQGAVTREFEELLAARLGVPHVVATTSGSVSLLMALMALGVGPGDEVIVPNRTWIATAHAPLLLGARPILVDVEPTRPIMDVGLVAELVTDRTRAAIPVHLNGRSADMIGLQEIADQHGLAVVEDAAQAFGSKNAMGSLGAQSDIGCFSLSVAKIIATGQGGFTATRGSSTYDTLMSIRTHGVSDVINASYSRPGFNFRFNDVLASIGIVQLERLDERIDSVRAVYRRYEAAMPDLPFLGFLPVDLAAGEIPVYVEVLCPERRALGGFLAERGIQARPFYPDLDTAPYLSDPTRDFPNARRFAAQGLFLPCGPTQPLENVDATVEALADFGRTEAGRRAAEKVAG